MTSVGSELGEHFRTGRTDALLGVLREQVATQGRLRRESFDTSRAGEPPVLAMHPGAMTGEVLLRLEDFLAQHAWEGCPMDPLQMQFQIVLIAQHQATLRTSWTFRRLFVAAQMFFQCSATRISPSAHVATEPFGSRACGPGAVHGAMSLQVVVALKHFRTNVTLQTVATRMSLMTAKITLSHIPTPARTGM